MKKVALSILFLMTAFGQTPVQDVKLPTYIIAGASYNQRTGFAGMISGIVPESQSVGLYASATADVIPVKFTDATTKKTIYLLSPSFRAGQHKVVFNGGKNMLLVGGDFGASFSGTSSISVGVSGSFTVTYVHQLSTHFAVGLPIRLLWMSGVGPGGTGAWNPVAEMGIVWKP